MQNNQRVTLLPDLRLGNESHCEQASLPREEQMLRWLLLHPWQREGDLAFALQCHRSTVARLLAACRAQRLVSSVRSSLEEHPSHWYALTEAGRQQLARGKRVSDETLARLWAIAVQERQRLLPRLPVLARLHTLLRHLVNLLPSLHQEAGESPRRIQWQWTRFLPASCEDEWQHAPVLFDALLQWTGVLEEEETSLPEVSTCSVAHANDGASPRHMLGIIIDPGFAGFTLPLIRQRRVSLLDAQQRMEAVSHVMPPLLVVVPTGQNRDRWQRTLRQEQDSQPLRGALVVWPSEQSPLPSFSAWQDLAQPAPCRCASPLLSVPTTDILVWKEKKGRERDTCSEDQRYNHEACKSVTKRHMASISTLDLGPRHVLLLAELAAHPLLSIGELVIFLCLEKRTLRHYLADLGSLVAEVEGQWRLTERGRRFLCQLWGGAMRSHSTMHALLQGAGWVTRHRLRTMAGLYAFVADVQRRTPSHNLHLRWWDIGPQGFASESQPVALLAFRKDGKHELIVWMVWQTEGEPLSRRIASIASDREVSAQFFPEPDIVLSITCEHSQEQRLWQSIPAAGQEAGPILFSTTIPLLQQHGPFAPI